MLLTQKISLLILCNENDVYSTPKKLYHVHFNCWPRPLIVKTLSTSVHGHDFFKYASIMIATIYVTKLQLASQYCTVVILATVYMNKTIHSAPDPTLCEEKGLVTT